MKTIVSPAAPGRPLKPLSPVLFWTVAALGSFFWVAYFLTAPAYRDTFLGQHLPFQSFWTEWGFLLGCFTWLAFWKLEIQGPPVPDIEKGPAHAFFALLFLLGLLTRFWGLGQAQGQYDIDQVMNIKAVEKILAGQFSLFDDFGTRPPFDRFSSAILWRLVPKISLGEAIRAVSGLFDLAALSLFYLIGKAWGNRRTGLFLMALGVISRPMLFKAYWAVDYPILSLAVALALGASVWALRHPGILRFILWGAAISFGLYVALVYRPWTPILAVGTGWILWFRLKAPTTIKGIGLFYVLYITIVWLFVFFLSNGIGLPREFLDEEPKKISFAASILFLIILTILFIADKKEERACTRALGAWGIGSFLALGFFSVLAVQPLFATRVEGLLLWKTKVFQADPWGITGIRAAYLFDFLGLKGGDYTTISDSSEPFYDLGTGLLVLAGLSRAIASLQRRDAALLFFGTLGLISFAISRAPHSGRLYTCLFPFYALAAFALEAFWVRFRTSLPQKWAGLFGAILLCTLGLGVLWNNFNDVWNWMRTENTESVMARMAREAPEDSDVYLISSPILRVEAVNQLLAGRKAFWLPLKDIKPKPPAGKEMRFLVPAENQQGQTLLKKLFPGALWFEGRSLYKPSEIKVWEAVFR